MCAPIIYYVLVFCVLSICIILIYIYIYIYSTYTVYTFILKIKTLSDKALLCKRDLHLNRNLILHLLKARDITEML